ncbi:MAG: aldo/keto reductase [Micrococcales bacterium]|nr:aldo/keto reductase [Micrococcales bacterium]
MQFTHLGRSGLQVSRLCLGTMNWGPRTDQAEAFAIMDRALEVGVNFFDTANVYGRPHGGGHAGWTEEIIGRWFALGGGRRESVVLATKVYGPMGDSTLKINDKGGLSAYKIKRQLDESLNRLQTGQVELYQMHHIDRHAPWDEVFGAFEDLMAAGKVIYAGASNLGARHLAYAQAAADRRSFFGLVSEQHKYSLRCRLPELEVLPACQELGLGVIPWSPLDGGLLGGQITTGQTGPRTGEALDRLTEAERAALTGFEAACKEIGERPADVALAWTLHHPAVTAPIIGPRTLDHFNQSLRALEIDLEADFLAKLDELFPGPGGPSPEAYAW